MAGYRESGRASLADRAAALVAMTLVALGACQFDSSPITGGPGLEPPDVPSGARATTGNTQTPSGGDAPAAPVGAPEDVQAGAGAPSRASDGGVDGSMPDGSSSAADGGTDAEVEIHDAAIVDAGGVGTCRGWTKPGGPCPSTCQSCDLDRGLCNIDCIGFPGFCNNATLECPSGWACHVNCSGLGVCRNGGVVCADGPCDVNCTGLGNCETWTIQCGKDACSVNCAGVIGTGLTFTPGDSCNARRTGC